MSALNKDDLVIMAPTDRYYDSGIGNNPPLTTGTVDYVTAFQRTYWVVWSHTMEPNCGYRDLIKLEKRQ